MSVGAHIESMRILTAVQDRGVSRLLRMHGHQYVSHVHRHKGADGETACGLQDV